MNVADNYSSAWVFGALGGIGNKLLEVVVNNSNYVFACDIKSKGVENDLLGATYYKINGCEETELIAFAEKAVSLKGEPDLLVIASGYVSSISLVESSPDEIDKIYQNNFKLVALVLKSFFESCSKDVNVFKTVVIISSNAGFVSRPNQPIYAAMKCAINSLIRSQALEWGKYNIKINAIAPGTVAVPRNSDILKRKFDNFPSDPNRPLGKIAFPKDIVPVFQVLLEKDLKMTGQVIVLDGGSSL